jgi:HPt (histidine-containing phosphotransfer) domain-containing protein
VRREAHAIRGAAGNAGAGRLRETATALEEVAGRGEVDGAKVLVSSLATAFEDVRRFCAAHAGGGPA